MNGILIPVITCVVGAVIGFLITRINDWIVERREFQRARRHLRTEAANVVRHYSVMQERVAAHETEVPWRIAVYLETCRFYGAGLGTFDMSTLRLFDEDVAEEAMYLTLTIRNNNSYVDQAKLYLELNEKEPFHAVCCELIDRCRITIARARRMQDLLRQRAPDTPASAPGAI
ncbi:hypothetical protein ABLE93_06780 [Xanthobacter sp. KR7-65]|uniref:hypothetical protein n=1 Tax=Xanthobacter sp. KR7-65 TaxID=3156612 RepID=UPI0032B4F16D